MAHSATKHQIVVPQNYRKEILNLAHGSAMGGHLGVNKTYQKILTHFYWPGLKKDLVQFCRSCHVCQMAGKPNLPLPALHYNQSLHVENHSIIS